MAPMHDPSVLVETVYAGSASFGVDVSMPYNNYVVPNAETGLVIATVSDPFGATSTQRSLQVTLLNRMSTGVVTASSGIDGNEASDVLGNVVRTVSHLDTGEPEVDTGEPDDGPGGGGGGGGSIGVGRNPALPAEAPRAVLSASGPSQCTR